MAPALYFLLLCKKGQSNSGNNGVSRSQKWKSEGN